MAGLVLLSGCNAGVEAGSRFVAQGPALPLPSEPLAEVDVATFEGILVGLRGKPVVVNLWASWCGPCESEAPLLERAWAADNGRTTFLGVDTKDGATAAARFIGRHGLNYPNVSDPSGEVARALGSRGLPTTYIFRQGVQPAANAMPAGTAQAGPRGIFAMSNRRPPLLPARVPAGRTRTTGRPAPAAGSRVRRTRAARREAPRGGG